VARANDENDVSARAPEVERTSRLIASKTRRSFGSMEFRESGVMD
jgi:hypothetical protein